METISYINAKVLNVCGLSSSISPLGKRVMMVSQVTLGLFVIYSASKWQWSRTVSHISYQKESRDGSKDHSLPTKGTQLPLQESRGLKDLGEESEDEFHECEENFQGSREKQSDLDSEGMFSSSEEEFFSCDEEDSTVDEPLAFQELKIGQQVISTKEKTCHCAVNRFTMDSREKWLTVRQSYNKAVLHLPSLKVFAIKILNYMSVLS